VIDLEEARAIKAASLAFRPDFGNLLGRVTDGLAYEVVIPAQPKLAIGISGDRSGGFRLQARLQDRSSQTVGALRHLQDRSSGELDVIEIGPVRALVSAERSRVRPLERGLSIGPQGSGTGTLGAFVRESSAPGRLLLLSNNHVLADTDRLPVGAAILQPGPADAGTATDVVARFLRAVALNRPGVNRVDAAVATVASAVDADTARPTALRGTVDRTTEPVEKRGRTSGTTTGRITAFELDNITITYPDNSDYRFDGQLEITGQGGPFSQPGDSGSLVTARDQAIGLVFAGTDFGGPGGYGQTYANPIGAVLTALGVVLAA